ncbi:MAG: hypothetical protein F3739_08985, partial [Nitrospinae bacterium]|nr:hypothetical protein [Nitrospinota bacterium]
MRLYKLFIIISVVFLVSGCADKDNEQSNDDIHPSFSELPEVSQESSSESIERVAPIPISAEDK